MKPLQLLLSLLWIGQLCAQTTATRTWTSTDGRKIEAAYLSATADSVKVRLANGSTFDIPLSRLSAEDQTYVKAQAAAPSAPTTVPVSKEWPRTVSLDDKPEIITVTEDEAKHEFIYRSPHYEFVCDSKLGANVVREFGRLFEATYQLNCVLPLDLKPTPERLREIFQARLFTEKADYMDAGGIEGSAGVYFSGKKALMVPLSSLGVRMVGSRVTLENNPNASDNAVLIHEITHQMMNHWLPVIPTWYTEGAAEYTEMLEYNSNGKFSLLGLDRLMREYVQSRGGAGGKAYTMVDLEELITIDPGTWAAALAKDGIAADNYVSAGLLTYYFYHLDDKGDAAHIIAWLRAIEGLRNEQESIPHMKSHLLRDRTYAQLADDVKKAFRKAGLDISFHPPGKNGPKSSAQ